MTTRTYIPSSGAFGKLKRLQARLFERDPIEVDPDRLVVSITFDDFPKSAGDVGAAELEKRGWRGTYYTAAGFIGSSTHHGEMLSADDVRRLHAAGHEIGCHTLDHTDLGQISPAEAQTQCDQNEAALRELGFDDKLTAFAFPYGESAPAVKAALGERFETLRGVQPGINRNGSDRLLLKAVGIDGGADGIAKAHLWIKAAMAKPGWLIFYAHDIQDKPTEWGCTVEQYVGLLDAIADSKAVVLPVSEAYRSLTASYRSGKANRAAVAT
ncbi:polysaccharide deacetylase family protein [Hyphobacterium sp.]|uniref:polysaccharide deacetylase family protein n=1 Tax=Hyphobacterium sp. TaxID=2004662 RepID=UPI003BA93CFB